MGNDCNFAHSNEELRTTDLTATKLCYGFTRYGHCNKGDTCTFAHGHKELRSSQQLKVHRSSQVDVGKLSQISLDALKLSQISQDFDASFLFQPPPGLDSPSASMCSDSESDKQTRLTFWL